MSGLEPFIVPAMLAGAGISAYGSYQQGKSAQQQAKAEAAWNAYNAKVGQREAEAEKAAARFESQQAKRQADQLLSRQRALIGKSGVEMAGSPLLVAEDTAAQLAKEQMNIRMRGERRVANIRSQSLLDISKASASRSAAAGYGKAALLNSSATILQGGSQALYMQNQME